MTAVADAVLFLKRYFVPICLFSIGLFFQLVVLPSSFPPSHYDVLGLKPYASIEEITQAYENLSSKWSSDVDPSTSFEFIKARYAFELLTNPVWKRDYDLFSIDEQLDVIERVKGQYDGKNISKFDLPLLDSSSSVSTEDAFNTITTEEFTSRIGDTKPLLILVYSAGSPRCAKFMSTWKKIANSLDGAADTGMVEVGEVQFAAFLAERKPTNQPFFRNGLPALLAFPPSCRSSGCLKRFFGDLSADSVVDWMATSILGLPRITYYSKESLGPNFVAKSGPHKVKVIIFSETGERATPFLRQAAKDYWAFASFAMVLWREEDSALWWSMFNVESAPAMMLLKESGVKPIVYHGIMNRTSFATFMEENKQLDLPQLRSVTSMELGCDARGYSRAGNDTTTWYCVILVGRLSLELNKMRQVMRVAQRMLAGHADQDPADNFVVPVPATAALKEKRLTFAWLDGESQKEYCLFYLHSENISDTCGPRSYGGPVNVPRLFIVRYKRNSTEGDLKVNRKPQLQLNPFSHEEDANHASQLVAKYGGSENIQEILPWISQIIEDGDNRKYDGFMGKAPDLIPEDTSPMWSESTRSIRSAGSVIKGKVQSILNKIGDHMGDPRVGPLLLLLSCILFGAIWLQNAKVTRPKEKVNGTTRTRDHKQRSSNQDRPSSITDAKPKDAYQMLSSDSESE